MAEAWLHRETSYKKGQIRTHSWEVCSSVLTAVWSIWPPFSKQISFLCNLVYKGMHNTICKPRWTPELQINTYRHVISVPYDPWSISFRKVHTDSQQALTSFCKLNTFIYIYIYDTLDTDILKWYYSRSRPLSQGRFLGLKYHDLWCYRPISRPKNLNFSLQYFQVTFWTQKIFLFS